VALWSGLAPGAVASSRATATPSLVGQGLRGRRLTLAMAHASIAIVRICNQRNVFHACGQARSPWPAEHQ
jgi:hypothetical protein